MLDIFTINKRLSNNLSYGVVKNLMIDYISNYYRQVTRDIIKYRDEHNWVVKNENILNRLLYNLQPFENMSDFDYFKYLDVNIDKYIKHFRLCGKYYTGDYHYGNIYKDSKEYYYVTENDIDLSTVGQYWRTYRPIKVTYTDESNFNIIVPDMLKSNPISIYLDIDIYKLCFQYKYWANSRKTHDLPYDTYNYIGSFLLPSLLESYLDYVCVNIFNKLVEDEDYLPTFNNSMPFSVSNYSIRYTNNLLSYIDKFRDTRNTFEKVLSNIPLINTTMFNFLQLDETFYSRRSIFYPYMIRMDVIISLLKLLGDEGLKGNTSLTTTVKREIRKVLNYGNIFPSNMSKEDRQQFDYKLFKILYLVDSKGNI